jgi:hypothetical protein
MAREVPESSSNLYSVSGPSAHSLVLDLPESLAADIETKNHADTKSRRFVMNRCYVLGDALDGRQRTRSDATYDRTHDLTQVPNSHSSINSPFTQVVAH